MAELSLAARDAIERAIQAHALPDGFLDTVRSVYMPLARWLSGRVQQTPRHIVGIQGSQGSGKSTAADFLKLLLHHEHGLRVTVVSIDDFYLTKSERVTLANRVHPLFTTRGVPGTHDVAWLMQTFQAFKHGQSIELPVFNKGSDDRAPEAEWNRLAETTDVLILEGWCVGIPPQLERALTHPVNDLERTEDAEGHWRRYVNEQLAAEYARVFAQLDTLVTLEAPSFDCVWAWRRLQEQKLIDRLEAAGADTKDTLNDVELHRFISHYQRLTEHALSELGARADARLSLAADHGFTQIKLS